MGGGVLCCSSCGGVSSEQLQWRVQEHQHHCDVITRTRRLSVTYQLLSHSQSNGLIGLIQGGVSSQLLGVIRLLQGIQDQAWDL